MRRRGSQHRVAASGVVEAQQVPRGVLAVAVVIGADLADAPIAEAEPLGAAVEPALAGTGVPPGHRPLDARLLAVLDRALHDPLAVDVLHRPFGVLADRTRALVGPETRVVMDRIVGEVVRNSVGVARVERSVVRVDVVEKGAHWRYVSRKSAIFAAPFEARSFT